MQFTAPLILVIKMAAICECIRFLIKELSEGELYNSNSEKFEDQDL